MNVLEALLLGVVQGLTEFFPVSSDGHLTLVPFFLGWDEPSLAFIVATHIGTLAAAVAVFKPEVLRVLRAVAGWKNASDVDRFLVKLLAVGSIPGVIAGVLLKATVEAAVERPVFAALMLGVTSWWLFSSEAKYDDREGPARATGSLTPAEVTKIGVAQATAILPGISRSGMTIGMGLRLGLERETAARFSFLLGIPIIFGAILFQVPDMLSEGFSDSALPFLVGIAASAVTGFWAIRWLLAMIQGRSMRPFGTYCSVVMLVAFIVALARG